VYGYLIDGAADFGGEALQTGDAVKVTDEDRLAIRADQPSELILVDVPMTFEPAGIWQGRI
jgi:redox-sensitive bicupin YhaK (pirin superfamily)